MEKCVKTTFIEIVKILRVKKYPACYEMILIGSFLKI